MKRGYHCGTSWANMKLLKARKMSADIQTIKVVTKWYIPLSFISWKRIWSGIKKSRAFPGEQEIWKKDNQRHEVFWWSLEIFYEWIVMGAEWLVWEPRDGRREWRPTAVATVVHPEAPKPIMKTAHNNSWIKYFQTEAKYWVSLVILTSNRLVCEECKTLSDPSSKPSEAAKH